MNLRKLFQQFKGKRVLITGHTGFKGSWLALWLSELGANVSGYALDPVNKKDNFLIARVADHLNDHRGDIRDHRMLKRIIKKEKPEIVFHLAAQSLVRESYARPKETFDTNIGGTVNLLECCRQSDFVKTIIVVTSDKCYENGRQKIAFCESDRLGGRDPYSASKACAEIAANAYLRSFFPPEKYVQHGKALATVRAGNVIGGGDWARDRIVPDCMRSLQNNRPIIVRNPGYLRPWQFVLEPLGGYLLLAARMTQQPTMFSGAWNFGPGRSSLVSVKTLVELLIKCYGKGTWEKSCRHEQLHEEKSLGLNISKSSRQLGWRPVLNLKDAVAWTADWYKATKSREEMNAFDKEQIKCYFNRLEKIFENN